VFSDRTLIEMATLFPASESSFLAIQGVGERKLAQYGQRFLAAISIYAAEHGLSERVRSSNTSPPATARAPAQVRGRSARVGDEFAAGRSIADLQAMYGVTQGTILNHLYRCSVAGQRFAAERILAVSTTSESDRKRTLTAFGELGTQALRPVYDAMDGTVSYEELQILRLYYLCLH
jgi:ATP-dependent DNA helicase RecQ